jgi:pilus assembly protein FimV
LTVNDEANTKPSAENAEEPMLEKNKSVIIAPSNESSVSNLLMENLTSIVATLLVILLGVYFFSKRRESSKADADASAIEAIEEEDEDIEEEWNDFDAQVDQAAAVEVSPVIAEAQALINGGDTSKALNLLEIAVGKEPHRSDIRLKHLAVLADNNMAKQFKIHYMGLKAIGSNDNIDEANKILANTPDADSWLTVVDDATVSADEKFPEMDYDADEDSEVGFNSTGDFDIDDIDGLDMASISAGSNEEDGDFDLEEFDAEMDEGSNVISGLDEDLNDDFSADLLATKEGGEGFNDLPDLDDLLGNTLDSHEEISLDDDLSLADVDSDLDAGNIGSLDDLDLDDAEVNELEDDIGLDEDFNFDLDDDDLDDFSGVVEDDDMGTRIELAQAYVELGDEDGAREILSEVIAQGTNEQKADAQLMLESL